MAEQPTSGIEAVTSRVAFPCDLADARSCTRSLRDFLAAQGLTENELFACELCLVEACNNAVEYAEGPARRRSILAEAQCEATHVELRVTDHTRGFHWPERLSVPAAERERGRGLFIIQSLMTEVSYFRGSDENILIMRKVRSRGQRPPQQGLARGSEDTRGQLAECVRTINGMVRELCFRSESLSAIFRCAAELGRTSDLEAFARRLLDDLLHLTAADWFVLRLLPPDQPRLEAFAASAPELRGEPLVLPAPGEAAQGAEISAVIARSPIRFDLRQDAPNGIEPLRRAGADSTGLVHPLLFGETLVGTLAVGRSAAHPLFTNLEAEVVRTFTEFLAIQIVNLRHREEQVQNRLVSHELEIARNIQRELMPASLPQPPGFSLAGSWESARQVGGDYYDAIPLTDHTLLLVVGDVMGKGVPAAMFAAIMRSLVRALAAHCHQPAELLAQLNRLLYKDLSAVSMFITAQLVFVDYRKRRVIASSAGHCPALLVSANSDKVTVLRTAGTPLGVLPDAQYHQETAIMGRPAGLLLHTDGLIEARSPNGEMFGGERLADWLQAHCKLPCDADQLRDQLAAEMRRFRGEAAMADDQAFLVMTETQVPVLVRKPVGAAVPELGSPNFAEAPPIPGTLVSP